MSNEAEIGRGKRVRRAYSLDDIAPLPVWRTRDPEDVNAGWQIDAYHVDIPAMAAPMNSVISPQTAIDFGRLGEIGVLDPNGLWIRYKGPEPILKEISHLSEEESIARLQQIYSELIQPRLIIECLVQIRDAGVVAAGKLPPQLTQKYWHYVADAGVDPFVIRGSTVFAEYVSSRHGPFNLKRLIYEFDAPVIVGGVCMDTAALHLVRIGAAGVLVGSGGRAVHSARQSLGVHAPMATTIVDVAAARCDYMDESGGRYVHVTADGGIGRSGDLARAIACGADVAMLGAALTRTKEAPGQGWHWGSEATHPDMSRGQRVHVDTSGALEWILYGPSTRVDGSLNFVGAFKRTMALTRCAKVKDPQKVEVVVSSYRSSEAR